MTEDPYRAFELRLVASRRFASIEVVAQHQYQVIRKPGAIRRHLASHFILRAVARSAVANDSKMK